MLWKVEGKWSPWALVLIHLKHGTQAWQLNLLTAFQKEILVRTKAIAPEKYEAVKKKVPVQRPGEYENSTFCRIFSSAKGQCPTEEAGRLRERVQKKNAGDGAVFPDGFTVDVEPVVKSDSDQQPWLKLPLEVHVTLTSNPKQLENVLTLNAEMDGVVNQDGSIEIKNFKLL